MGLREATLNDIKEMQRIRNAVKENVLSDPALVKDEDVADYISKRGKGWVVEENDYLLGFAIVSLADKNVWALF
ncbi:MAG TPA: GNAT family N-acetyltransferase, partial [Chitinophagaceae bacterium]|nr:GNAT family N-acetyltransferase [Chitinophagaceae bacterium]